MHGSVERNKMEGHTMVGIDDEKGRKCREELLESDVYNKATG